MLRSTIRILSAVMLFTTSGLANDLVGTFHEQDSTIAPPPHIKESYFATLAPMPGESSKYLGINGGMGSNHLTVLSTIANHEDNDDRSLNGHVGLFGGYGKNYQHFYLGAEVSTDYNFIKRDFIMEIDGKDMTMKVRQPLTFTLDIIPGYLVRSRDLLFYGRAGLAMGLYNVTLSDDVPLGTFNSMRKYNLGPRMGLGVEYFMTKNFSLLAEYLYTRHGKLERLFVYNDEGSYSLDKLDDHQVKIGLSINF